MQVSRALNPRRIARSLVTISVLTLIQTVVPAVVVPEIVTPKAEAVDVSYASFPGGTDVLVPSGAISVTITLRGGAGGTGGSDVSWPGLGSSAVGYVSAQFPVSAGDRLLLYPGGAGGDGATSAQSAGGGTGGARSNPISGSTTSSFKINGSFADAFNFNGGTGGNAGSFGTSGAGGGGGAASFVALNDSILAVAGGGGGGGGAGAGSANAPVANSSFSANGTSARGGNGAAPVSCGANIDGGGGGGGGGGWFGGAGGASVVPLGGSECSGTGGSRGANHVASGAITSTSTTTPANGAGFITYDFNFASTAACPTDVQTNDIYTIVRVTSTTRCTWSVPATVSVVDLFLVGGGAGGAGDSGGGGGGGAILSRTAVAMTPNSSLTLKVGYGGAPSNWGFPSDAFAGDSTTVTTSTGTTFSALGGSRSVNGNAPGGAGGLGGVASNGGFNGGAGGAGGACFGVGSIGKTGATNYFYSSVLEYGGGGGGGSCPNGAATTAAAGVSGGGSGGFASSSTVNQPGTNGIDGRGGGGGGGTASGTGMKLPGGKGGSGVILIRYATNSADAFPSSLTSSLYARFAPNDLQVLDPSREALIDSAGRNAAGVVTGSPYIFNRGITDGANSTRSSKTLMAMKGTTTDSINLTNLPSDNYTMFHVARYVTGGATGRLFSATTGNWISGFYWGANGCAHHNAWLTSSGCNTNFLYGWELSMDQLQYYRHNGEDVTLERDANDNGNNYINAQSRSNTFGINNYWNGQKADWEVADVIIFDRKLSPGEIRLMEGYLARIYGLTLDGASGSNETDTAVSFNGAYYRGQYASGFFINDTFTLQAWVNPKASCVTSYCSLFSYEGVLVTKIEGGIFKYALYGTSTVWVWASTDYVLPTDEWHHISLVKRLVGNQSNAIDFYVDGQLVYTDSGSPYNESAATNSSTDVVRTSDTWYYLGVRQNEGANYRGFLDEFKLWKVARTATEIATDMHSNDPTNLQLQLYYDFNQDTLSNSNDLRNLAFGGPSRSDMTAWSGPHTYVDVKEVSTVTPYTTIRFPRTYITQSGGWKVPDSVTAATTIVVGGGGGGGFGESTNRPAGAGGGGGVTASLTQSYTPGTVVSVKVGQGGLGGYASVDPSVRNGQSSFIGVGGTLTALGGGGGGNRFGNGAGGASVATGGGSGESNYMCSGSVPNAVYLSGTFAPGATVPSGNNGSGGAWGWGGSGGGARGAATDGTCNNSQAGIPGPGYVDPITNIEYGRGGNAAAYTTTSAIAGYSTRNNGWGGIISYSGGNTSGVGYRGSAGAIIVRYITALRPSYTKPAISYHNVGMTETFTTNVAMDSATVGLTRTFRWESTTAGETGTYLTLKQGTGAQNAFFSWVPTDTSTSGSRFLYRLTVTDSDTAGLFITDSSTAFAIINPALKVTSTAPTSTLAKRINVSRNETFTITLGTPTYRATLSPVIPGITIDTSTAGSVVLRIGDTATVGTWLETLTVTDSVAASVVIPLTINIAAPPTLLNAGEIVSNGLVLNLDAGNSQSLLFNETTTATNAIWRDLSGNGKHAQTSGTFDSRTCTAPVYSPYQGGYMNFNGSTDCFWSPYIGYQMEKSFTVETWFKLNGTTFNTGASIISQNYSGKNINFVLGDMLGNNTLTVAFYEGTWRQCATGFKPTNGVWNHIVGTYDGANMIVYVNGARFCTTAFTGGLSTNVSIDGTFIGRRHDGGSTYYANGSIATARVYRIPLTETQVAQNFNATKVRFDVSNVNLLVPNQKYGTRTLESFTATSGYETDTVTFAVGDRTGVDWDTTTVTNQVNLAIQESLTVGTFLDTVTVTDSLGQSTFLPIRMTVTKADTLTVFIDTPTALSYTGSRANFSATIKSLGAVGLESGTAFSATVNFKPGGTTCATGGYCRVGDIGPAGGVIFIDTSTASSDGRIYEAAPQNWTGSDDLASVAQFCTGGAAATANITNGSQIGIGWGDTLTANFDAGCSGGAAQVAADLTLNGFSDWFVPSENEAVRLYSNRDAVGLIQVGSNWNTGNWGYWTSTENSASVMRVISNTSGWSIGNVAKNEATKVMLRPVRAFKSCWAIDTCTALSTTDTPTAAGVYSMSPSALANLADLQSKYTNVVYASTPLTINRVAPSRILIPWINTNYPETFTVNFQPTAGNQTIRYSTTNGTASGCVFDYKKIATTSQGTCNITITRAADRNFTADTTTATIFFLTFVNSMPTGQVGSGSTIALNGATSLETSTVQPPSITGLSTLTLSLGAGGTFTITGTGFTGTIIVKFWRNKEISASSGNGTTIDIPVSSIASSGATSGRISVITAAGQAVSVDSLTITP